MNPSRKRAKADDPSLPSVEHLRKKTRKNTGGPLPPFLSIASQPFFALFKRFWGKEIEIQSYHMLLPEPSPNTGVDDNSSPYPPFIPQRVLDLGAPDILMNTRGHFIVREDYVRLLENIMKMKHRPGTGVFVTGQPGIGKYAFLLYILIRRLQERKTTIFSWDLVTCVFKEDGAFFIDFAKAIGPSSSVVPRGTLALIDADWFKNPPNDWLIGRFSSLFCIVASSPNPACYSMWMKRSSVVRLYMSPWTWSEIVVGASLCQVLCEEVLAADPETAYRRLYALFLKFGPIPRVLYQGLVDPDSPSKIVDTALRKLSWKKLRRAFGSMDSDALSEDGVSPSLVLILPSQEEEGTTEKNGMILQPITQHIMDRIISTVDDPSAAKRRKMYHLFSTDPRTSAARGWVFQSIAHHFFCAGDILQGDNPLDSFPVTRMIVGTSHVESDVGTTRSSIFPLSSRERRAFLANELQSLIIVPNVYYTPAEMDDAAFDSFVLTENGTLYVTRITVSDNCSLSARCFQNLAQLLGARTGGEAQTDVKRRRFILVTPAEIEITCSVPKNRKKFTFWTLQIPMMPLT